MIVYIHLYTLSWESALLGTMELLSRYGQDCFSGAVPCLCNQAPPSSVLLSLFLLLFMLEEGGSWFLFVWDQQSHSIQCRFEHTQQKSPAPMTTPTPPCTGCCSNCSNWTAQAWEPPKKTTAWPNAAPPSRAALAGGRLLWMLRPCLEGPYPVQQLTGGSGMSKQLPLPCAPFGSVSN